MVRALGSVFVCNAAYLYNLVYFLIVFLVHLRDLVGTAYHLAAIVRSTVARGCKV